MKSGLLGPGQGTVAALCRCLTVHLRGFWEKGLLFNHQGALHRWVVTLSR